MTSENLKEFELTGRHVAFGMCVFFGVIIAVNFFMASLASRTWTGLVVKNSYVASQGFNGELAKASSQKQLGWNSAISYEDNQLTVQMRDREGRLLGAGQFELTIGRPAFEQEDRTVLLTGSSDGYYTAPLTLGSGEWALKVSGQIDDTPYRRDARMIVTKGGKGRIE